MRCPKCNDPDFGNCTLIANKEGWYKEFTPAHLEIIICEKCGHRMDAVEADAFPSGFIWEAHWKPGVEGSFGQSVHQGPDWYEKAKQDDKFEFKPRRGWAPDAHFGFDMSFDLTDEQIEQIRKIIGGKPNG